MTNEDNTHVESNGQLVVRRSRTRNPSSPYNANNSSRESEDQTPEVRELSDDSPDDDMDDEIEDENDETNHAERREEEDISIEDFMVPVCLINFPPDLPDIDEKTLMSKLPEGFDISCIFCPITHTVMRNPTFVSDGYTYEHSAITTWFYKNLKQDDFVTSPMTGQKMSSFFMFPNLALRTVISTLLT